jgi:hypothetical protein
MKLLDIFLEGTNEKYEFGAVLLYFDFPEINKIQDTIDPKDIYYVKGDRSYGLEDEPHTTLLYGLHDGISTIDIKKSIEDLYFGTCILDNASLFINPEYDVLKFDVEGYGLHDANHILKQFPHTSSFPVYHPHLTIGYLKKGTGEKYIKNLNQFSFKLKPKNLVYSKPNGERDVLKINLL